LTDHQIRGCPVDEPPAKICKRENDGVEGPVDEPPAKRCKRENDGVEDPVDEPPAKRCKRENDRVEGPVDEPPAKRCKRENDGVEGPVDEPLAKRCKREDYGVEGTYGYELECYLKDLPATVCCADQLPARAENRAQSFVVNTDSCNREGTHWVAFHFPKEGPAEFFDSFGLVPETYHRRFRNVLIANAPQYKFNPIRVQPEDVNTCGLYCVHFVKYRYRNFTLEDIVNEFSARDPKTIETELKDIYE
jgi:hypothetical protein